MFQNMGFFLSQMKMQPLLHFQVNLSFIFFHQFLQTENRLLAAA